MPLEPALARTGPAARVGEVLPRESPTCGSDIPLIVLHPSLGRSGRSSRPSAHRSILRRPLPRAARGRCLGVRVRCGNVYDPKNVGHQAHGARKLHAISTSTTIAIGALMGSQVANVSPGLGDHGQAGHPRPRRLDRLPT
jgi:hypothetical protein